MFLRNYIADYSKNSENSSMCRLKGKSEHPQFNLFCSSYFNSKHSHLSNWFAISHEIWIEFISIGIKKKKKKRNNISSRLKECFVSFPSSFSFIFFYFDKKHCWDLRIEERGGGARGSVTFGMLVPLVCRLCCLSGEFWKINS